MSHSKLEVPIRRFRRKSNRVTAEMAARIRVMVLSGMMQHDVAAHFRINQGRVSEVMNGKLFPEVPAAPLLPMNFEH